LAAHGDRGAEAGPPARRAQALPQLAGPHVEEPDAVAPTAIVPRADGEARPVDGERRAERTGADAPPRGVERVKKGTRRDVEAVDASDLVVPGEREAGEDGVAGERDRETGGKPPSRIPAERPRIRIEQ